MISSTFLWLDGTAWTGLTAIFTGVVALATFALAFVAYFQIRQFRAENTRARTIAVIERYDFDPILNTAIRQVRNLISNRGGAKAISTHRHEIIAVLNYFEQIAIGIQSQVYDEYMLFDFLEGSLHEFKRDLIESGIAGKLGCAPPKYFSAMCHLSDEWFSGGPPSEWPAR